MTGRIEQGKLRTRWRSTEPLLKKRVPPTPRPSHRGWRRGSLFPPWSSSRVPRSRSSPQTGAVRSSWDPLLPCIPLAPSSVSRQLLIGCGEQCPSSRSQRREPSGSEVGGAQTGSGSPSRVLVPSTLCPTRRPCQDSRRAGAEEAKETATKGRSKSCGKRGAAAPAAASAASATEPASRAGLAGRARRRGELGASSWSTRTPTS